MGRRRLVLAPPQLSPETGDDGKSTLGIVNLRDAISDLAASQVPLDAGRAIVTYGWRRKRTAVAKNAPLTAIFFVINADERRRRRRSNTNTSLIGTHGNQV